MKKQTCYYIVDISKFENFDLDDFLLDEKQYGNILIVTFHMKLWLVLTFVY